MELAASDDKRDHRPDPDDFVAFLPWACDQYQMDSSVVITKVVQNEYVSVAVADKAKKNRGPKTNVSRYEVTSMDEKDSLPQMLYSHNIIKISAYCDIIGNLVELKFDKNIHLPCLIFKIMALIIKYQSHLKRITINGGMDKHTIYEMNKFLHFTNITEICFDGSYFPEANYDLLLEGWNKIQYMSLARCKINDAVLENISRKLAYPLPASKFLAVLILTSNRITDKGLICLAEALRSNRCLSYISLADNKQMTDDGVRVIINSLTEFPLTQEEIMSEKSRHLHYLKDKNAMVIDMIKELRSGEFDKRAAKRKTLRPTAVVPSGKKGKLEKEGSLKSLGDSRSNPNLDFLFYDKAVNIVEDRLGEFSDPFSSANTIVRDGVKYCYGNNAVSYLNLAYNNLSYLTIKKLSSVLVCQKLLNRRPKGLVNLCVDGNNLPVACKELTQIDDFIDTGLISNDRRGSIYKKRNFQRNTPR